MNMEHFVLYWKLDKFDADFVLWNIMTIMPIIRPTGNCAESAAVGNMFVSVAPTQIQLSCLFP